MIGLALAFASLQDGVTVYRVGRLIPVASEEIADAWLSVQKGRILAFGAAGDGFRPPEGARLVDRRDLVCMPGLVDAGTPSGALPVANEESSEITPAVRAARLVDPSAPGLRRLLSQGVTSLSIAPGTANVIGGLTAVLKLKGRTVEEMLLRDEAALFAAMGRDSAMGNYPPRFGTPTLFARRPTTRMGVVFELRRAFLGGAADPVLARCLQRKLPLRVTARRAADIESALQVAEEFGLELQIEGAQEAYQLLELLRRRKPSIVLRPHAGAARLRGPEEAEERLCTFSRLVEAGLIVAVTGHGTEDALGPRAMGAYLTRAGADRAAVLKALTLWPAQILGVSDRVGSIAAGKDADLLFLSGDPLQVTAAVAAVAIDGQVVEGGLTK